MANGYIIFKDRSIFSTRWTGYDEIIRLAVKELQKVNEGIELSLWLSALVPIEYDTTDKSQWGTGFMNKQTGEVHIGKELDLRSLTEENQILFWAALKAAYSNLMIYKKNYSFLNPDRLEELLKRKALVDQNQEPLLHSDWTVLADEAFQKLGPGW